MGLGVRVKVSDALLLACDACQARAGFAPTLLTLMLGWWAIPRGPSETLRVLRDNGEQQRRYGSSGSTWRFAAFGAWVAWLAAGAVLIAVGAVAVLASGAPPARAPDFVADMNASADVRRRARAVPIGLAEGSEPPASTAAGIILQDVRASWPDARVGVRVDAVRGIPARGEIAGPLERIEAILHVADAHRFPEDRQRIVLRGAAAALRASLGDADTRVRLFGSDGRGPGVMLPRGATEAVDLPIADVR